MVIFIFVNSENTNNMGYTIVCSSNTCQQFIWYSLMWQIRQKTLLKWHRKIDEVGTKSWICWLSHDECNEQAIKRDEILNLWWKPQFIHACIGSNNCRGTLKKIKRFSFDLQKDHLDRWKKCIYTSLPYYLLQCVLSIFVQLVWAYPGSSELVHLSISFSFIPCCYHPCSISIRSSWFWVRSIV